MSGLRRLDAGARSALQDLLGYQFRQSDLLDGAITHSSLLQQKGTNYERLEFLGDRVLGLCVAEMLFARYDSAKEGELSVRLNQLVSARTCAAVADSLQLHRFIQTGNEIKKLTGSNMLNLRADVVEALIGAIYLDGGLEPARAFILSQWKDRAETTGDVRRDAKTELQEWSHAKFGATPVYRLIERSGPDHDPRFTVEVEVKGMKPHQGTERSKRTAEQVAATGFLEREGIWQTTANKDKTS